MIPYRDLILIFVLALVIRALAAMPQQQPNYFDAIYYYVNGLNIAQGRGFEEDFVWNYLNQPGPPPQPSYLYWMPLTSILSGGSQMIGGLNYRAAQIPFVILSTLLAPISYWTAYTLSGQRRLAWFAGLFAIFSGFYFHFWTAIDNFAPFGVAGSLALIFAWRAILPQTAPKEQKQTSRSQTDRIGVNAAEFSAGKTRLDIYFYPLASGLCIGLAHLSRADGLLLLIAIFLIYFIRFIHELRTTHDARRTTQSFLLPAALIFLAYLLIMTPWFVRNWQVAGDILPTAGSKTIWLTTKNNLFDSYNDFFSYDKELSPRVFFAQGWGPILQGRWWALQANVQTVVAVWGMIFLTPLAVIGGWSLRRDLLMQLAGLYGLLLFLAMTVVFAFPGARGGLFHSGAALLPFVYATAMVGLDKSVDWAAARRRRWDAQTAKRFFGVGLLAMAIALSSFIYYQRVLKNNRWNSADSLYPTIAAWIAEQDSSAVVMIGNPPAYRYYGGGLSVMTPNEDPATTLQVMERYGVDYLILEPNHPEPLSEIYENPTRPSALELVHTFRPDTENEVYVFELRR